MIYQFKCECGRRFDVDVPIKDYKPEQVCECGKMAKREFTPPHLNFWFVDHSQMNPETAYKEGQECGLYE
jgi:predicted nucleic acid-binding Zn ribbon protein